MNDHAPERSWRHLDTMQFETVLKARIPRTNCAKCGVKTISVPWSHKYSRFTVMFEAFTIEMLQASSSVSKAAALLGLSWDTAHEIMARAVKRGLAKRDTENVANLGIDEKSFGKGQDYVSVMTDVDSSRVLDVVSGRDEESVGKLWETLTSDQIQKVKAVAIDMWQAFENSVRKHAPQADIVHDRFHISKHLNESVDKVRRQDNKALRSKGDDRLVGTKQLWLFNFDNIREERREQLTHFAIKN